MLSIFGHQFVVFVVVRGIFAESWTVVTVFCGIFAHFFTTVMSICGLLSLWRCHFGRFVVTNQCSLCSNLHFSCFVPHFCVFPMRFEHGRFLCKGGRDMAGIIPTTFAVSCNRPAAQPFLLSFSSSFLLPLSLFSIFPLFSLFSHFSPVPSLFFTFFQ